jgi:hypothetical protein
MHPKDAITNRRLVRNRHSRLRLTITAILLSISMSATAQNLGQILGGAARFAEGQREAERREFEARISQLNLERLNRADRDRRLCQFAPYWAQYVGTGIRTSQDGDVVRVSAVEPGSTAIDLGIRVGDKLISVNHYPVSLSTSVAALTGAQPIYEETFQLKETGARERIGRIIRLAIERNTTGDLVIVQIPLQHLTQDYKLVLLQNGVDCSMSQNDSPQLISQSPPLILESKLERSTLEKSIPTGDFRIQRCFYKTSRGYEFEVNYRGRCPNRVNVNPESNLVYFD